VENYIEGARIGKGSEGSVFLATHRITGAQVVIKKIYLRANPTAAHAESLILSKVALFIVIILLLIIIIWLSYITRTWFIILIHFSMRRKSIFALFKNIVLEEILSRGSKS
jgi:hypothetical protein